MPANMVDDHRLILYRDGAQPQDITEFIGNMTTTDELNALSVELTFDQIISHGINMCQNSICHLAIKSG